MNKEVHTFHSGKYLFSSDTETDLSVISEAVNVYSRMPLFPETVTEYRTDSLEKAVMNEARLEGSTITLDQVKSIITHKRSNFSQDTMAIQAVNISSAYKCAEKSLHEELSQDMLTKIHNELTESLPHIKDTAGTYRKGGIKADEKWLTVEYTPPGSPLDINFLLKNLFEWLENDLKDHNPLIKAFLLHLHLKKIQPYYNCNGSAARIMETWYLRKNNFKILPYLLSVVYNINITEYYRAVSEFYATSNITAFIRFISDALSVSVAEIRDSNFAKYSDVISADYLANLLREKVIIKRQYDLLNLIKQNNLSFTQEDLQLKKPFTKLYGKVSRTTVSRDIKKFEELGLIRKNGSGYGFNYNII